MDPLEEVPSLKRNFDVLPPLPHPLSQIPVGGRLAHFAPNWHKITNNKWALSIVERGYKFPFKELLPLSKDPIIFQQTKRPELEEEVSSLLQKRAVEEILPESPKILLKNISDPKKRKKK